MSESIRSGRDEIIAAAREIIAAQTYCAIATIGADGQPQVRTMNPFPPEDDMTVWMATHSRSRKVEEIRNDPRVCLYYADHANAIGLVAIHGRAELVDEMDEKLKRKRDYWDDAFPDWRYLLLIKVVPERIEVLNYARGVNNEGDSQTMPAVELQSRSEG